MAFIRKVRTASGATAVQIAEYSGGRQRIVAHVGSAHTVVELGVLLELAGELLTDPAQLVLDVDAAPAPRVAGLLERPGEAALFGATDVTPEVSRAGAGRVVGTESRVLFAALAAVYADLGFDALDDYVFRDLVLARVVEPTSLLDVSRVLTDLGQTSASYATMKRTLTRVVTGAFRDDIAELCFAHAATAGDISLVLYDVTVRHEVFVVRVEVRDHYRGGCRGTCREAEGSLTGETSGRVGAALTKPCRASTVRWRGRGEHAAEVYERNRCHYLS